MQARAAHPDEHRHRNGDTIGDSNSDPNQHSHTSS
jgi:hypothetical protein